MNECKTCHGRGRVDSSYTVNVCEHQRGAGEVLTTECCDDCGGTGQAEAEVARPLTDEQIEAIAKPFVRSVGDHWCNEPAIVDWEGFARAIEAAHGINPTSRGES